MENESQPILPTTHGKIKGQKRMTVYDDTYYSFERIPYAKPPLGDLRFRAPIPASPWPNVLDCTNFGNKPLQKNLFTGAIEGDEDCLYLNIFAKKLRSEKLLPVLVFIHGGAFQNSEATTDILGPDYFMKEDVVLMTFNYRVGPLGFLSLKDPSLKVPGNAALKDQILALQWLKANCKNFNGDPNNITVIGSSAGGASVNYLMLAKQCEGLFQKGVLMSGSACNKFSLVAQGDYAYRLAKLNGYQGPNDDKQVFEFLMQMDGSKLVGHNLTTEEERLNGQTFVFGPTIESYLGDDCVIPTKPHDLWSTCWGNAIPIMIGGTSFEGLIRYRAVKANTAYMELLNTNPEFLIPMEKRKKMTLEESRELGEKILKMYMGDEKISVDNIMKFLKVFSERAFWQGFYRCVRLRVKYSHSPTYLYRFDFDSPTFNLNRLKFCGPGVRGVIHSDDLSYLFYGKNSWKLNKNSEEYKTIKRMIGLFTAFARNSDPNCPEIEPIIWDPVEEGKPNKCLNISEKVEMIELPETERVILWDNLFNPDDVIEN